jgi:biopolymer transport protein ExbD
MKVKKRGKKDAGAAVMMSPLIDCVFLLLIFFLVTSQLKRWERQIPVVVADPTASVAPEMSDDTFLLGVDTAGNLYRAAGRSGSGVTRFEPMTNPSAELADAIGRPVELVVEAMTPFQTWIDALDRLQDFELYRVGSRIRDGRVGPPPAKEGD